MFFRNRKPREPNDDKTVLDRSPYSTLWSPGYQIPEQVFQEIRNNVIEITRDCIEHNLMDEFTLEEMEGDGEFYLNKLIHQMFAKLHNDLKMQKLVIEKETIGLIRMLQETELSRQRAALKFAQKELGQCQCILGAGLSNKNYI